MMNFSKDTINQVVNAINDNMSEIKALKNNAVDTASNSFAKSQLIQKYGLSEIEADEIIEDLVKGISEFDEQMANVRDNDKVSVQDNLSKLTEGMDEDKRHEYYANILAAIQLLTSGEQDASKIESTLEECKKLSNEELISRINGEVNDNLKLESIGNSLKDGFNADVLSELASKIEMNKEDFRFNTALWIYILQRDDKIKLSDSEIGLPAKTIGTLAAAGIETILTTNELAQGNMSLKKWQVVMKWILGAVVFAGLLIASVSILCYVGLSFFSLLIGILGTSTIAFLISFILTILVAWTLSGSIANITEVITDWLSKIYDKYVIVITEKIKSICSSIKLFVEERLNVKKEEATDVVNTQTEESTVSTTGVPVQASMA